MNFISAYIRKDNHYSPANFWSFILGIPCLLIPFAEVILPILDPTWTSVPDYMLPLFLGALIGLITNDTVHQHKRETEFTKRCKIEQGKVQKSLEIQEPPTEVFEPPTPKRKPQPHPRQYDG